MTTDKVGKDSTLFSGLEFPEHTQLVPSDIVNWTNFRVFSCSWQISKSWLVTLVEWHLSCCAFQFCRVIRDMDWGTLWIVLVRLVATKYLLIYQKRYKNRRAWYTESSFSIMAGFWFQNRIESLVNLPSAGCGLKRWPSPPTLRIHRCVISCIWILDVFTPLAHIAISHFSILPCSGQERLRCLGATSAHINSTYCWAWSSEMNVDSGVV
jgi:hypothetical protein